MERRFNPGSGAGGSGDGSFANGLKVGAGGGGGGATGSTEGAVGVSIMAPKQAFQVTGRLRMD